GGDFAEIVEAGPHDDNVKSRITQKLRAFPPKSSRKIPQAASAGKVRSRHALHSCGAESSETTNDSDYFRALSLQWAASGMRLHSLLAIVAGPGSMTCRMMRFTSLSQYWLI
ncbi:MAG: hypothetical protein AAF745_17130, partial [Planctomycetota bacterium]